VFHGFGANETPYDVTLWMEWSAEAATNGDTYQIQYSTNDGSSYTVWKAWSGSAVAKENTSVNLGYVNTSKVRMRIDSKKSGGADDKAVDIFELWVNGTPETIEFINDTWTAMSGTDDWSNVSKRINSTVGSTIKWCVYANDTDNDWNGTSCDEPFTYITTADDIAPVFSSYSANSTDADRPVNFSIIIADNVEVSGYIFETNNTGIWVNTSWTALSGYNILGENQTVLNDTVGMVVNITFYANDTTNNWAIYNTSITTTIVAVNYTFNLKVINVDNNGIDSATVDINATRVDPECFNYKLSTNSTGHLDQINLGDGVCGPYFFRFVKSGYETLNFTTNITRNEDWVMPLLNDIPPYIYDDYIYIPGDV